MPSAFPCQDGRGALALRRSRKSRAQYLTLLFADAFDFIG